MDVGRWRLTFCRQGRALHLIFDDRGTVLGKRTFTVPQLPRRRPPDAQLTVPRAFARRAMHPVRLADSPVTRPLRPLTGPVFRTGKAGRDFSSVSLNLPKVTRRFFQSRRFDIVDNSEISLPELKITW
ncbi:DUF6522 family protein [Sedimentitalea sp. XS_ASV28]|uniref:DUF6522 family protein n=1 Tax=Sedimentitalea sp. XS_ASV28 TaxID=3241296 RepID=UPI0035187889